MKYKFNIKKRVSELDGWSSVEQYGVWFEFSDIISM